nr:endoplasmic reticulum-Golgi intermediate compartment protein 3 isoform X1 [Tanacetum cinerariifolium]
MIEMVEKLVETKRRDHNGYLSVDEGGLMVSKSGKTVLWSWIVPIEYKHLSKEVLPISQFSVTKYFSPMKEHDRTWLDLFMMLLLLVISY